jgi:hypothetical protein
VLRRFLDHTYLAVPVACESAIVEQGMDDGLRELVEEGRRRG